MRAVLRNSAIAMIVFAAPAFGSGIARGQATSRNSELVSSLPAKAPLMIGDKLKISLYETIDVGAPKPGGPDNAPPQAALRTFYQRMDVSGDYVVEQDGAISIPLLGRFQIEGRTLDDIRAEVALSFTNITTRTANIDIKIVDRSPVYVVGPVKNPGAYKYVPGMIVLQAIALAGGLDRGEQNLSGLIEGTRQMERLRSLSVEVQQLLARRARLVAERDGAALLPVPAQLATMAGDVGARNFLATESTILRAEQFKRQQEQKEIGLKVVAARSEVDALNHKLDQADIQRALRSERLDDIQKLKDRGLVTNNNVLMLRSELSDIEAHRQDYFVALVQAKARLAEVEGAGARLAAERAASLAAAIAGADKDLAVAREAMISAGSLASILYRPAGGSQEADTYQIVRQSRTGATTHVATETSPLMPGDVLKIELKGAATKPVSIAPLPSPGPQSPDAEIPNKSLIIWPEESVDYTRQRPTGSIARDPVSISEPGGCKRWILSLDHLRVRHHERKRARGSSPQSASR